MTRILTCRLATLLASVALLASVTVAGPPGAADGGPGGTRHPTKDLLIRAQRICPVTGRQLGSMGRPVETEIRGRTVFLCCRGCLEKPVRAEHWAAMDIGLAAAQGTCPVFEEPLPRDALSVVAEGRVVFVCCPPCADRVSAEPGRYLAAVDRYLEEYVRRGAPVPGEEAARRDGPSGGGAPSGGDVAPASPGTGPDAAGPSGGELARPQAYSCPMHPQARSPRPGRCPLCGMALAPEASRRPGGVPGPAGSGSMSAAVRDLGGCCRPGRAGRHVPGVGTPYGPGVPSLPGTTSGYGSGGVARPSRYGHPQVGDGWTVQGAPCRCW